jgi:hypothetical protein
LSCFSLWPSRYSYKGRRCHGFVDRLDFCSLNSCQINCFLCQYFLDWFVLYAWTGNWTRRIKTFICTYVCVRVHTRKRNATHTLKSILPNPHTLAWHKNHHWILDESLLDFGSNGDFHATLGSVDLGVDPSLIDEVNELDQFLLFFLLQYLDMT